MNGLLKSLRRTLARTFGAALLALCAHVTLAQEKNGDNSWPQWLEDAMAQEDLAIRLRKVDIGDGRIQTRLAGKAAAEPQVVDGGWYIPRDIGTDTPLECWAFTSVVDPGTMAHSIAEQSMAASATLSGPLGERQLHFLDTGAIDGVPYVALEWLYSVGEGSDKAVGLTKVRVAVDGNYSFACAHNFLGYRQTFALAFEHFVREAKTERTSATPYYEEIIVQRVGDQPIGVAHSMFTLDASGDTRISSMETMLMPIDGSTLTVSDTWRSGWSRPDGTIINQRAAKSENGQLAMDLALDPLKDGGWAVSGSFGGKDVEYEIEATTPMSELGQFLTAKDLLADTERNSATLTVWLPSADPSQFLTAAVAINPSGRAQGFGQLTVGPIEILAQFDENGSLRYGTMTAGPAEITHERIWVRGELF